MFGRNRSLWLTLLLVLVTLLVFGLALPNPFYFDDFQVLLGNSWLTGGVSLTHWFRSAFADRAEMFPAYRPILMMSYALDARLFGAMPVVFRSVNILLHLVNAWLVAQIFLVLLRDESLKWLAWGAAFFFLLHPIQTLPINFLWKRSELLQVFFVLLGLALHVRERVRMTPYRIRMVFVQFFLFLLAVGTKESGILLLPLIALADLSLGAGWGEIKNRRSIALYVSLSCVAVFYLWFRLGVVDGWLAVHTELIAPDRRMMGRWSYFLSSLSVLPQYISLWLVPRPLLLDDPLPLTAFPWWGAIATLSSAALTALLAFRFRRNPAIPFALGLFWFGLLPTTGVWPLFLVMDQVRLYLPLAGVSLLLVFLLKGLAEKMSVRPLVVVVAVSVLYGGSTLVQNMRYRLPILIWGDVTAAYPQSGVAWAAYGSVLQRQGRVAEGNRAYEIAARVEPTSPAYRLYALLPQLERLSSRERGEQLDAIRTAELDGRHLMDLAIWEATHSEERRAEVHFLEVAQRFPTLMLAHYNLGTLWERVGKLENARRAYANALQLAPQNVRNQLAVKRLGRPKSP